MLLMYCKVSTFCPTGQITLGYDKRLRHDVTQPFVRQESQRSLAFLLGSGFVDAAYEEDGAAAPLADHVYKGTVSTYNRGAV